MHEEARPVSDKSHILICGDGEDHSAKPDATVTLSSPSKTLGAFRSWSRYRGLPSIRAEDGSRTPRSTAIIIKGDQ